MDQFVVVACTLSIVLASVVLMRYHSRKLPPSVHIAAQGLPRWKAFADLTSSLGPVVTARWFGQRAIIVNTVDAAVELLEKRSHFSCKPRWPMAELLGRQNNSQLNPNAVRHTWARLLEDASHQMLDEWLHSPPRFYEGVHKNIEELIVQFAYGRKPDDQFRHLAKTVMQETSMALQPGRWFANSFPAVTLLPTWLPGTGFLKWAASARDTFFRLTREPFIEIQNDLANGKQRPSFVAHALQTRNLTSEEVDVVRWVAGSLYSAGIETLTSLILQTVHLLLLHPEVQMRAYAELQSNVGTGRLPGLQDKDHLPYIDCIIQEVHRFNPVVPVVPHSNTTEDWYLGYFIPKKSWVIGNIWAMLHDETKYTSPETFSPERFLHQEGSSVPFDPRSVAYGFGRRRCPGLHMADSFVFLVVARAIALFEFTPAENDGRPILPKLEWTTGITSMPKPFPCRIIPRPEAAELLAS